MCWVVRSVVVTVWRPHFDLGSTQSVVVTVWWSHFDLGSTQSVGYSLCAQVPRCLVALQHSVYAVLVGKMQPPDWLTHGIPRSARTVSTVVSLVDARCPVAAEDCGTCMASDGRFIYVHNPLYGLVKIGSGYSNTAMVRRQLYLFIVRGGNEQCFDAVGWAAGRASGL